MPSLSTSPLYVSSTIFLMLALMFGIFYFMLIRPENKRKKAAEEMRNNMKKGEQVTTIGGLVGKVVSVTDTTVVIETSEDRVRVEFLKTAISSTASSEAAAAAAKQRKWGKKAAETEEKKDETPSWEKE